MAGQHRVSDRELSRRAGVSHHTISKLRAGSVVDTASVRSLVLTLEPMRKENTESAKDDGHMLKELNALSGQIGQKKLAEMVRLSPTYLSRILAEKRPAPSEWRRQFESLKDSKRG